MKYIFTRTMHLQHIWDIIANFKFIVHIIGVIRISILHKKQQWHVDVRNTIYHVSNNG